MRHIEETRLSLSDNQYRYIDKKTRQEVFDAVNSLQSGYESNVKVRHIWLWLDSNTKERNRQHEARGWDNYNSGLSGKTKEEMRRQIQKEMKRTISKRTIERIIHTDSRIVKGKGNSYHIDEAARFETRYQRPDLFGQDMLEAVMKGLTTDAVSRTGKLFKIPKEAIMSELIRRFGSLVLFNFIEAIRPFKDNCMSLKERNELVDYWKKNALDIDGMFDMFQATLGTEWTGRQEDKILAPNEIDESSIDKMLEILKKSCPDIYENLVIARRQQMLSPDEISMKEYGKPGFVHAKSYHLGWTNYWKYLEQTNPVEYKREMEKLKEESKKVKI